MRVIALHGDFASGAILRRDTGIDHWEYPDWKRQKGVVPVRGKWVAVGFSQGGSEIGHISQLRPTLWDPPIAAVLYESPLIGINSVGGDFPVLWIRNDRGRGRAGLFKRRAKREMESTLEAWKANGRDVTDWSEEGKGRHIETTNGWPPLRHGWDRDLNERILEWIDERAAEH